MGYFTVLKKEYKDEIIRISQKGPEEEDYPLLINFFSQSIMLMSKNHLSKTEVLSTREWFKGAMTSTKTLQGHVCTKPHCYDGDFEIIDKIYQNHLSPESKYGNWDIFFHKGHAPQAVRNRKDYFINTLNQLGENSSILNLASGPCRDILEYSELNNNHLEFHNVELDKNAVEYSKKLLNNTNSCKVHFKNVNVFRFVPDQQYDLIWSAGLFDYFDDKVFQKLIDRFSKHIKPGGKMIIGNFCSSNTSRAYMEYGEWFLNHRSSEKLRELCSNVNNFDIEIDSEPLNVNLFLKLSK